MFVIANVKQTGKFMGRKQTWSARQEIYKNKCNSFLILFFLLFLAIKDKKRNEAQEKKSRREANERYCG
jgi:hypothetical protein